MHVSSRWFSLLGGFILAGGVLGLLSSTGLARVQYAFLAAGGVLFIVGGTENRIREQIPWYQLVGLGDIAVGLGLVTSAFGDPSGTVTLTLQTTLLAAAGVALAVLGADYFLGGVYLEIPEEAP
ncbi:hypothetical protein [Salarchaeum sp. JOR-1]|uniref:hypothetical protein n=1 Tax=Salarchaeum sp. JOR-1 TaxID=2599399 RepID=UPI0011986F98|nr:hypothetical protein [Salarchaeum sp. JOR-1]QDX39725.1 hypothetical protein FQU85_01995 [Salarchaeum sp. JOR-1]